MKISLWQGAARPLIVSGNPLLHCHDHTSFKNHCFPLPSCFDSDVVFLQFCKPQQRQGVVFKTCLIDSESWKRSTLAASCGSLERAHRTWSSLMRSLQGFLPVRDHLYLKILAHDWNSELKAKTTKPGEGLC